MQNSIEPTEFLSNFPSLLEKVYDTLKEIKSLEDCQFMVVFKTSTDYYDRRGPVPYFCYIYPVFNGNQSRLALNDYEDLTNLGFFHEKTQTHIRTLNQLFSIKNQNAQQVIYSEITKSVMQTVFSFKQEMYLKAEKRLEHSFYDTVVKAFKKNQTQEPLYIQLQHYLLGKKIKQITISPEQTQTEKIDKNLDNNNTKAFKI